MTYRLQQTRVGQTFHNVSVTDGLPATWIEKIERLCKEKLLSCLSLTIFSFRSCSIFQSVWLVGRQCTAVTDIFFSTFWNFCTVTILWIFNVKKYVKKLPDDWANFFILVLEIGRKATPYEWPKQPTYLCTEARKPPEQDSAIAPFFFHLHWGRLT